ncbi:LOW QUALITY PROTEIN: Hypothetical protein PHPALM_19989 [Phytophthora palmivora]|uniref:Integrase zinc-binding domain-containing protein n=1 Tax=Phytophthora palmivora TaxID=4796 RepID=A0A2P4XFZ7_9STRA|nr:LOW QUALITY PROTEIN: Hypothetical protein PHPALM_19989 [Phytophthora palmivora]
MPMEAKMSGEICSPGGLDELPLQLRQLAVIDEVPPLQDVNFDWATPGKIRLLQDEAIAIRTPEGVSLDPDSDLYETSAGKIWPPPKASDLHQCICVIGHAGASGHRGEKMTLHDIKEMFFWRTIPAYIDEFVRGCIHC